jgi:prepilin-type N-terminal cleavage/methylation domain-containing protein
MRRAFTLLELVIVIGIILVLMGLVLGVGSLVLAQSEERQVRSSMQIIDTALLEFEQQAGRPMVFEGWHRSSAPFHTGHRRGSPNASIHVDVPLYPMLGTITSNTGQDPPNPLMTPSDSGGYGWAANNNCYPWIGEGVGSGTSHHRQWLAAALAVMGKNPACASILTKADPKLVRAVICVTGAAGGAPVEQVFNMTEFVDPWGQQVVLVFPGRRFYEEDREDDYDAPMPGEIDPFNPDYQIAIDSDGTIRTPFEQKYGVCRNQRALLVSAGPDGKFGNRFADPNAGEGSAEQKAYEQSADNIFSYEPLRVRPGS